MAFASHADLIVCQGIHIADDLIFDLSAQPSILAAIHKFSPLTQTDSKALFFFGRYLAHRIAFPHPSARLV